MTGKGWNGKSSAITGDEIKQACEALGFDLNAAFVAFFSRPANHPALAGNGAPSIHTNVAASAAMSVSLGAGSAADAPRDIMTTFEANDKESDEMDSKAGQAPPTAEKAGESDEGESEGFEGKDAVTLIGEILAPASAHMTPHLAQMLPGLIAPLVEAATRGPRVVVKTVVKTVSGEAGESASAAPVVNVLKRSSLYSAFGLRKADAPHAFKHAMENVQVAVCDYANAPAIDRDYVWSADVLAQLGAADVAGLNVWAFGHAGTGKTEGVRQYAARLARPFVRIPIDRTTEPQEIIGQEMPRRGGGMEWRDGKLTRAFRIPHCVILIDEPTLLRSGSLAVFQTALDTREIHLPTGEVVSAADGVFIVAADNTAGCGDDSGRYVDTAAVNVAFMDRFAFRIGFDYLPPEKESGVIASRAALHAGAARLMVDYAGLTRSNADSGKLTMGVTPRRLLSWAKAVKAGIASDKAFASCIVAGAAPEDRETLIMLEAQSLRSQHGTINGIARGSINPDAPPASVEAKPQGDVGETGLKFPDDDDTV
jgi:MoxR-like ATPase